MKIRNLLTAAMLTASALTPVAVRANDFGSFTVEGFGGWQHLNSPSFSSVSNAASGSEGTAIFGADVLAGIAGFGVGAVVDKTVSGSIQPWAGALLAGILIPVSIVRIEALGELGRRGVAFEDMFKSSGQTFIGFRPGVSLRLGATAVILGVSGVARWPTSNGDIGSPDYGFVLRVGFGAF
jgi:hypothetical protein